MAVKHVFASLFNDRAISYRVHQGYDHRGVALSMRCSTDGAL
ncbi:PEP/pyruvate-binding domain-containing protein [Escherichia coli]